MDVFDAIHNRHSQGKVKPDSVPHALIEKIIISRGAGAQSLQGATMAFRRIDGNRAQ